LRGEQLTWKQAALAKCADCTGGYDGGKSDCEIPDCPLHGVMPYRENKEVRPKKKRSEKQISSDERLALIRSVARRKVGL
jgi:hypothetical protein